MSGVEVHDAGDLRKYRTEIPNVVLEMGLSPYALTLYLHLKRTAGQNGKCWKSVRTLAEETSVSKSEIARTRTELEERELIAVEQPKDPRKPSVVSIVDIWEKNFDHFREKKARVPHGDATCPTDSHKERTIEEGVEANASSGIGNSAKPVGLEKYIVDEIYQAMKEADFRLPNEHFKYHLGRAKDILDKDSPTDEEIEALPQAFVDLWTIKGKADAHSSLMEMRRQKARPDLVKVDGPAAWEPVNPHSPKPPMDPAAYEREKKRREEVAAMLRSVS